uniref:Uncharacterized protein n=1 Tax=Palpitomonas bilix TaxID=652834 RepID=A0A7S3GKN0_9EUKA|mmetsp:Transcript_7487/g.19326  ORF Transcript_7487/g.19326 Transcript_7487/m.19326 type:complete len:383 (+) Transcript_7487:273-1421(+)
MSISSGATLFSAALWGRDDIAKDLLSKGHDPNAIDEEGKTPLHTCAVFDSGTIARQLVAAKASIDVEDKDGNTPLEVAIRFNAVDVVAAVLDGGAPLTARKHDKKGAEIDELFTPLHLACQHKRVESTLILVRRKAPINAVDKLGRTPLHIATLEGALDVIKVLIDYGAKTDVFDNRCRSALHWAIERNNEKVALFLASHTNAASINAADDIKRPCIQWAVLQQSWRVTKRLIERGADLMREYSRTGKRIVHIAAEDDGAWEVVRVLIQTQSLINVAMEDGWTPLLLAAKNGCSNVCKVLLKAKADIDLELVEHSWNALHVACYYGSVGCVEELLFAGADTEKTDEVRYLQQSAVLIFESSCHYSSGGVPSTWLLAAVMMPL